MDTSKKYFYYSYGDNVNLTGGLAFLVPESFLMSWTGFFSLQERISSLWELILIYSYWKQIIFFNSKPI